MSTKREADGKEFEVAVRDLLVRVDLDDPTRALIHQAGQCDRAREALIEAANNVSRMMLRLCEHLDSGGAAQTANPLTNVNYADVPVMAASLRAKEEAFFSLAMAVLGRDGYGELQKKISNNFEK